MLNAGAWKHLGIAPPAGSQPVLPLLDEEPE
jgi:hypothetical protein